MSQGKILIVDDEVDARSLLQKVLSFRGYQVVEAADGPTAIQKLAAESPDLVILDVAMPGMDGFEVLERMRKQEQAAGKRRRVPVIFLSAKATGEARARGLGLGASDYIAKPFHKDELYIRIQRVLDRTGGYDQDEAAAARAVESDSGTRPVVQARIDATVLVVEDTVAIRRVLASMVEQLGCRALSAESGPEALKLLENHRVDLILLDIMMPGMDGLEMLARVKGSEFTAHIPVIMCTAKGQSKDVITAIKSGAADYVVKPFRKETIRDKILKALGNRGMPGGLDEPAEDDRREDLP